MQKPLVVFFYICLPFCVGYVLSALFGEGGWGIPPHPHGPSHSSHVSAVLRLLSCRWRGSLEELVAVKKTNALALGQATEAERQLCGLCGKQFREELEIVGLVGYGGPWLLRCYGTSSPTALSALPRSLAVTEQHNFVLPAGPIQLGADLCRSHRCLFWSDELCLSTSPQGVPRKRPQLSCGRATAARDHVRRNERGCPHPLVLQPRPTGGGLHPRPRRRF